MKQIKLTQGQFTLVDDEDYEYLNQWKWYAAKDGRTYYACRNSSRIGGKQTSIKMHREILGLSNPKAISDHIDGNGLNNQKGNLREATKTQNNANRKSADNSASKYLGVNWLPVRKKWKAELRKNGKLFFLGRFNNEIDAAIAYNKKAVELHGEFARLNKIIV